MAKTILLVEDEQIIALSTQMVLKKAGYQVNIASTGEEAIEHIEKDTKIDLILMDIDLCKGIDGTDATRKILQLREIPVVFCSSHTEPEVVEKTEDITSYGYIVKSSGSVVLLASIRMAFRLFEAKNSYKNTFTYSLNGICIHRKLNDASGKLIDCEYLNVNPAFQQHTGLSTEDVHGKTIRQIYPEGEADGVIALYDEVLRAGKAAVRQFFFEPSNNWFQLSIYPMEGDLFSVVIQNITEQRNAREQLEEKTRLLENITDNMLDLLAITDLEGNFTFVGKSHSILGYDLDSLIGRNVFEFVHPEDIDRLRSEFAQFLQSDSGERKVAYRYRCKDGSYIWLETIGQYLKSKEGEYLSLLFTSRNITEQKRAAAEAEERIRELAENVEAILWEYDIRLDRWTYVAPQVKRILGYDPGEWKDVAFWAAHIHPEDRNWATSYCNECTAKGMGHQFEYRFQKTDGSYVWIRDVVSVVMKESKPVGLRGFMIDISPLKEAELTLGKQLREKELLLRETVHRIKNNILSIERLLNLQSESAPNQDVRNALQQAMFRVSSIRQLYEQMLSAVNSDSINLKDYLDPLVDQIITLFPQAGHISVTKHIEPISLTSRVLFPVGIMVNELLTNTLKYAFKERENGSISIAGKEENGSILISVCDDGTGFPEAVLQGETSGFGTNLVKMLAQQLDGTANLYNSSGGCAEIRFPSGTRDNLTEGTDG